MDNLKVIKMVFITLGSALASCLGILAAPLLMMVCCNIIDWISGLMAAPRRGQKISSDMARDGMIRKIALWLLVVVGVIVDQLLLYAASTLAIEVHVRFLVACIVSVWIICNELLSILENLNDCGVKIPAFLVPLVKHIRTQVEDTAGYKESEDPNTDTNELTEQRSFFSEGSDKDD